MLYNKSLTRNKDINERKPFERCIYLPRFKPTISPKMRSRTWERALSPFRGPPLQVPLAEAVQRIENMEQVK